MGYKNIVGIRINAKVEFFKADTVVRSENGDILSGELVHATEGHNLNTDAGLNFYREAISRTVTVMSYIACGSGSTAADPADTELEAEIGRVAILGYDDIATGAVRFRAIFESNQGNGNLQEFGLFNAISGGTMAARYVLDSSFTKDTSLMVRVNWTVTFSDL